MAAARRYAVASYDRTHLAYLLATSRLFAGVFIVALVALLAGFMYSVHGPADAATMAFFKFIPSDFVHNMGIAVMAVMGAAMAVGLFEMVRHVRHGTTPSGAKAPGRRAAAARAADATFYAVATESLAQTRFRKECAEATTGTDGAPARPWYLQRWFIHFATMWGFLGLLGATMLDYGLELLGLKAVGTAVPIWYPVRLLGTLAGVALIYGTTVLIIRRLRKSDRSSQHSTTSDWSFLLLLWVAGITGFVLELALYLPQAPAWGYPMFLVHVGVAMALVLLVPFGKFAHVLYRPIALMAIRLRG
jgi:hypothetical protein